MTGSGGLRHRVFQDAADGRCADAQVFANLAHRHSVSIHLNHLCAIHNETWTATNASIAPCFFQSGNGALTQANIFLFGNRCENTQNRVLEDPAGVQEPRRWGRVYRAWIQLRFKVTQSMDSKLRKKSRYARRFRQILDTKLILASFASFTTF